jgi:transcriptional regulator with XRE-family HTH domain
MTAAGAVVHDEAAAECMRKIALAVEARRVSLGMSQDQLSALAGITERHYRGIKSGQRRNVTVATLVGLACALEVPLVELLNAGAP